MSKRRGMSRMTTMEVGVMGATSRAHRRMSVFCSHIRQVENGGASYSPVSQSYCQGSSEEEERASLTGSGKEKDCIFCRISSGESPSFKIYEDDVCMCILDSYPLIRGHSLLIPKSHFSSLGETSPAVIAAMFSKVPFLSKAIMKATQCDSFNLLVNNGVAAGQVVFHTHLHIIPRRRDDKLWTTKNNKFNRKSLKTKHDADALVHCIRADYYWMVVLVPSAIVFVASVVYLLAGMAVAYSAPKRHMCLVTVENNYCASINGSKSNETDEAVNEFETIPKGDEESHEHQPMILSEDDHEEGELSLTDQDAQLEEGEFQSGQGESISVDRIESLETAVVEETYVEDINEAKPSDDDEVVEVSDKILNSSDQSSVDHESSNTLLQSSNITTDRVITEELPQSTAIESNESKAGSGDKSSTILDMANQNSLQRQAAMSTSARGSARTSRGRGGRNAVRGRGRTNEGKQG